MDKMTTTSLNFSNNRIESLSSIGSSNTPVITTSLPMNIGPERGSFKIDKIVQRARKRPNDKPSSPLQKNAPLKRTKSEIEANEKVQNLVKGRGVLMNDASELHQPPSAYNFIYSQLQGELSIDSGQPKKQETSSPEVHIIGETTRQMLPLEISKFMNAISPKNLGEGLYVVKVFTDKEYEEVLHKLNLGIQISAGSFGEVFKINSESLIKKGSPYKDRGRKRTDKLFGIKNEIEIIKALAKIPSIFAEQGVGRPNFPRVKLVLISMGKGVKRDVIQRYSMLMPDFGDDLLVVLEKALNTHNILTPRDCSDFFRKSIEGIARLHSYGFVHRDVKLDNLCRLGAIDLGLAKKLGLGEKIDSCGGSIHGLAPEIVLSCPHGKEVDVYALGCAVFQFYTGEWFANLITERFNRAGKLIEILSYDDDQRANQIYLQTRRSEIFPTEVFNKCSEDVRKNIFHFDNNSNRYNLRSFRHYNLGNRDFSIEPGSVEFINQHLQEENLPIVVSANPFDVAAPFFYDTEGMKFFTDEEVASKQLVALIGKIQKIEKDMFASAKDRILDRAKQAGHSYEEAHILLDFITVCTHPDPSKRATSASLLKHPFYNLALNNKGPHANEGKKRVI